MSYENTAPSSHPCQTERVYVRRNGTYHATNLVRCPVCGLQSTKAKGQRLPWCDGDTFWTANPNELRHSEDA